MAALTNDEWNFLHPIFPNLVRAATLKTGPEDEDVNCIRFAVGTPGLWIECPDDQDDFEAIFHGEGWVTCPRGEGTVDGWAEVEDDVTVMQHASRFTTAWESKLGEYIRISHVRDQLGSVPIAGSPYGNVVVSFKKPTISATAPTPAVAVTSSQPESSYGGGDIALEDIGGDIVKVDNVVTVLKNAHSALVDDFEQRYSAWKKTWFSGTMAIRQKSADRAQGKEWDALVALTARILPQTVNKLRSTKDLFAVQLYNKLQTDPKKKVSPKDIANYYYLDAQAKKIIQLYDSQITEFEEHYSAWKTHQSNVRFSSKSSTYTTHASYDAIVAMGVDQVAPLVMAKYAVERGGWWHELLHELVHGKKSGASTFDKPELYKQWKEWFEAPGGSRAPA